MNWWRPREEQAKDVSQENFLYQLILQKRVQESFPNVEIALSIISGADDQQLQCRAFVLKDETDKEQTSHIHV